MGTRYPSKKLLGLCVEYNIMKINCIKCGVQFRIRNTTHNYVPVLVDLYRNNTTVSEWNGSFSLFQIYFNISRMQCWGSMTFWCGSGYPDPYLWIMAPDPTPFFIDFQDKKISYFFLTLAHRQTNFSLKIKFLLKFCVQILFCRYYFSPLHKFMKIKKDPDSYLRLMDPVPDPGGP